MGNLVTYLLKLDHICKHPDYSNDDRISARLILEQYYCGERIV